MTNKIVKTMTQSAWDYVGLERFPEHDFEDDGNHFKMYIYKDFLEVSYITGEGQKYISIRDDYSNYNETSYNFFHKNFKDAANRTWNFNGVKEVDLDTLKEDLEVVYQALIEAKKLWDKEVEERRPELTEKVKNDILTKKALLEEAVEKAKSFDLLNIEWSRCHKVNEKYDTYPCWSYEEFVKNYKTSIQNIDFYNELLVTCNEGKIDESSLMNGKVFDHTYEAKKILATIEVA